MLPILTTLSVLTSWYGPGFHGNLTANGERYNQHALTAAHKTLPFGTRLRVCFKSCAVVRVTDRGPYIRGREIDLSKGAADAIGLTDSGVGRITVTRLN
jgi:rare lipoprotein A